MRLVRPSAGTPRHPLPTGRADPLGWLSAGPVPWEKWRLYYLLEGLGSGELQQLKVESEEGDEEAA